AAPAGAADVRRLLRRRVDARCRTSLLSVRSRRERDQAIELLAFARVPVPGRLNGEHPCPRGDKRETADATRDQERKLLRDDEGAGGSAPRQSDRDEAAEDQGDRDDDRAPERIAGELAHAPDALHAVTVAHQRRASLSCRTTHAAREWADRPREKGRAVDDTDHG